MEEGRLETVKEDLRRLANGDYYDTHDFANALVEMSSLASELVEEVERLEGRLQAVCDVLADAEAFGRIVEPNDVLRAVRGWRTASLDEIRDRLPSVPTEVLMRWIETGKALVKDDGTLVMDDLTGLSASIADMGWKVD